MYSIEITKILCYYYNILNFCLRKAGGGANMHDTEKFPNINRVMKEFSKFNNPEKVLLIALEYLAEQRSNGDESVCLPLGEVVPGGDSPAVSQD